MRNTILILLLAIGMGAPAEAFYFDCVSNGDDVFDLGDSTILNQPPIYTVVTHSEVAGLASCDASIEQSDSLITISATSLDRFMNAGGWGNGVELSGSTDFNVDSQVTYDINGWFDVDDVGADSAYVKLAVALGRITANTGDFVPIYQSTQESVYTNDVSFILGREEGDGGNILGGSSTGVLQPGTLYRLLFEIEIYDHFNDPSDGASASGSITLKMVDPAAPALPALSGFALAALITIMGALGIQARRS